MTLNYLMVIPKNDEAIDHIMRIAANHRLACWHKVGVYGQQMQKEIYVTGSFLGKCKFMKVIKEQGLTEET